MIYAQYKWYRTGITALYGVSTRHEVTCLTSFSEFRWAAVLEGHCIIIINCYDIILHKYTMRYKHFTSRELDFISKQRCMQI